MFEASVKILELETRIGTEPMVLIARLDDGRSHYAVELESRGLCVLCKLGSWVNVEELCSKAVLAVQMPQLVKESRTSICQLLQMENLITPESSKYNSKKRLAMEAFQSVIKRQAIDGRLAMQTAETEQVIEAVLPKTDPIDIAQPACADMMENIRTQYFEALYLSKVRPN